MIPPQPSQVSASSARMRSISSALAVMGKVMVSVSFVRVVRHSRCRVAVVGLVDAVDGQRQFVDLFLDAVQASQAVKVFVGRRVQSGWAFGIIVTAVRGGLPQGLVGQFERCAGTAKRLDQSVLGRAVHVNGGESHGVVVFLWFVFVRQMAADGSAFVVSGGLPEKALNGRKGRSGRFVRVRRSLR